MIFFKYKIQKESFMNKEKNNSNNCPICGKPTHKKSKYCIFHASAEEKTKKEFKNALIEYVDKIKKEDGDYDFKEFVFIGNIYFRKNLNVTILKNASFERATFKGNALFGEATFNGDADFLIKSFEKIVTFEKISLLSGMKLNLKVKKSKESVSLERAYLENIHLKLHLGADILIDFTDTLLRNTKIDRDQIENHILQEKEKKFSEAQEIYLLLKNNFHSIGKYEEESWAFKKEKDMERFSHSYPYYLVKWKREVKKENFPFLKWLRKKNFRKWIISAFSNIIYGYGEKPWNVVIVAGALIIIFAYFFTLIGIGNPEIIKFQGKIHPIPGTDMRLVSEGILQNTKIM